ncbi:hypothetical protein Taro_045854 [Colocasia esculenta]|uniref:Fucosyltransferase n=1 Tax=Colocasia esculenta TaxID=4460 RepID=A0A843WN95_COLES|nr:hypothetical protein [Colocasia esculenta]
MGPAHQVLLEGTPPAEAQARRRGIPGRFLIPAFEVELVRMFPKKVAVFHHLGRYLFHPSNEVWNLIMKYYEEHLATARERKHLPELDLRRQVTPATSVGDGRTTEEGGGEEEKMALPYGGLGTALGMALACSGRRSETTVMHDVETGDHDERQWGWRRGFRGGKAKPLKQPKVENKEYDEVWHREIEREREMAGREEAPGLLLLSSSLSRQRRGKPINGGGGAKGKPQRWCWRRGQRQRSAGNQRRRWRREPATAAMASASSSSGRGIRRQRQVHQ